jgi:hypothetical protein
MTRATHVQLRDDVLHIACEIGRAAICKRCDGTGFYRTMPDGDKVDCEQCAGRGTAEAMMTIRHSSRLAALVRAVRDLDYAELDAIHDSRGAANREGPDTEHEAANSLIPVSGIIRRRVLNEIAILGKATDSMLERQLKGTHQTVSSARNFLMHAGWVQDSQERVIAPNGRKKILWELTPAGRRALGFSDIVVHAPPHVVEALRSYERTV